MANPVQSRSPQLECRPVAAFEQGDLASVREAMNGAASCDLGQSWLAEPERDFVPGTVRVGRRHNVLVMLAELTDRDIFSAATGPNQRLWELGDVFEVFLRPETQRAYVELQIAPNNQRLQLRYADENALKRARETKSLDGALVGRELFQSNVWAQTPEQKWWVLAMIPADSACEQPGGLAGSEWRFSFGRYDYTRGRREPVISSSSAHTRVDFHRQEEWGILRFS